MSPDKPHAMVTANPVATGAPAGDVTTNGTPPNGAAPGRSLSRRRTLEDVAFSRKFALLLILAAVGGCGVGILQAHVGWNLWPSVTGLSTLVVVLITLGQRWMWRPLDYLVRQLNVVKLRRRAAALKLLPVQRGDEIGQIARAMHDVSLCAIQNNVEIHQLRRTLDQRIASATRQACGQLAQLAMRDPLTDLANRRFLEEQLRPLVVAACQSREEFACVIIDLDNFKQVNDTLGHAAGDDLLVFLAGLIRAVIRREDYAVRLGGDEFVVFMPGCTAERAAAMADHLVSLFRQHVRTTMPAELACDLSIGIAMLQDDLLLNATQSPLEPERALLELADQRLYAAKHGGKGRVVGGEA